jgi:subtilisin family serine protease/subtilisin-like proprotein convertase family protein
MASDAAAHAPLSSYIIMLQDDAGAVAEEAAQIAQGVGGRVHQIYQYAFKGFSIELPESAVSALEKNPRVRLVEPDGQVQLAAQSLEPGIDRIEADLNPHSKIDGLEDPLAVNIAIIDTGISLRHADLRVAGGANFVPNTADYDDGNGHGSHVAGIAAALDNGVGVVGVAPGARLWAVRVLNNRGGGSDSQIIAGMDWVLGTQADNDPTNDIHVVNMSWQAGTDEAMSQALQAMADAGIILVAAAGNSGGGSVIFPARHPAVMAVSATVDTDGRPGGLGASTGDGADDTFASFTNWGDKIEIAAPGSDVYSTSRGTGYKTLSGTSMASPHVAGAAALLVAQFGPASDSLDTLLYRQVLVDSGQPQSQWRNGGDTGERGTHAEPLVQVGNWVTSPLGRIQSHVASQVVTGIQTIQIDARDLNSAPGTLQVNLQVNGDELLPATYNVATGLYEANWDSATQRDGFVSIAAMVADDEGYVRISPPVTLLVENVEEVVEVITYSSDNVPKPIQDQASFTSTLAVADSFRILDVNVQLNIAHTAVGDLTISLQSPSGSRVPLVTRMGGSGDNFTGTIFDDEAATSISAGAAPFEGRYRAEGLLSAFDNFDAAGVWTLVVADAYRKNQGALNSWSIQFTREVASAPAAALSLETFPINAPVDDDSPLFDAASIDKLLASAESTWTVKSRVRMRV